MKTIKSYVFVVATILGIVATTTLKAQTTFSEGVFNYEINPDGTTLTITGYDDSEIEDLVIPTAVTHEGTDYNVTAIGDYSFFMKTNLTGSLTIPDGIITIGEAAFYKCTGITGTLTIGNTVTIIGPMAFDNSGISGDLVIPNSVTEVGHRAFCLCGNLTGSLTLPNTLTLIDDYAFCSPFTGELVIPNTVTEIYSYAFSGSQFSTITIGENVTKIWQNAFEDNNVIEKVVIPNSVVEMERWIFRNCTALDTLVIGSGMVNMNDRCLHDTQLSNVTILAENPPYTENLVTDYTINSLIVPCESLSVYHNSEWAQYFSEIIEDCGHEAVSELDEDPVSVFPNPTSGVVKIEAEGVENVKVYNALGEMVFEASIAGDSFEYDFDGRANGVYLIKVETRDGVVMKRITVN